MTHYVVPLSHRLHRIWIKPAFRMAFRVLARVRISGLHHIPLAGPYVAAINHISLYDPPLAVSFWPENLEVVGASDVFRKKGQGTLLRLYGVVPVHRGEYDRRLLETIFAILQSGRPLLIAPEGGRSHVPAMRRALPGIGYIVEHAHVPVLPVGLVGTTDDFWQRARRGERPHVEMRIGRPIVTPPASGSGTERRLARQTNADLVMRHIAGLLPAEYHGVYAGQAIPE